MPGFNTLPAVGGGGGQANMTYVASIHMSTFNRSWAQGGTAGYYALYSTNQENGYAYFVGSGTSTGAPLNRLVSVTHSFTRIDIIAPVNDMISLYKAKVKSTSVYNNPFDADGTIGKLAIPAFPSTISSSGNFVLPNNALPLVNVLVVGGGGSGGHHGGGGGGGGGIVKLTAYQAVGTTACTIGGGGSGDRSNGGRTYFGNVYALGGGGGGGHGDNQPGAGANTDGAIVANGGGAGSHSGSNTGGTGTTQTAGTGLGTTGSPVFVGGFKGGNYTGGANWNYVGAGGGGAGGNGADRNSSTDTNSGGTGHASDITGSTYHYSYGGGGASHSPSRNGTSNGTYGSGGGGYYGGGNTAGTQGAIVVRYYIP